MGVRVQAALRLICAISILSAAGWAQLARYDGFVAPAGYNFGPANVAVCQAGGSGGPPCTPQALIYNDQNGTYQISQPFSADANGRYHFYALAGSYVVDTYGSGYTTTLTNITVGVPGAVPALKPLSNDLVQYVSNNGNDSNDGLSWGTAKLTVGAACTAIGSNAGCTTNHAGLVYIAPGFTGSVPHPISNANTGPLLMQFGISGTTVGGSEVDWLGNFRIWNTFGAFELVPSNSANGSNNISSAIQYFVTTCWNGSAAVEQDMQLQATTPSGTNSNITLAFSPFGGCTGAKFIADFSPLSWVQFSHVGQGSNHDLAGACTAAAATTCTVTFAAAYTSAPVCTVTDATNITTVKVTPSTTQLVITTAASSSDTFDYICVGNPN